MFWFKIFESFNKQFIVFFKEVVTFMSILQKKELFLSKYLKWISCDEPKGLSALLERTTNTIKI